MADIDPADQWVLDPETGSYEFRPDGVTAAPPADPPAPGPAAGPAGRPRGRRGHHRAPRRFGPVRRPRPARPPRRRGPLAWGAGVLGLLMLACGTSGYLVYRHLNGNIHTVDVGDAGSRNVAAPGPLNILLIGTDSRLGLGRRYGDEGSVGHADTTILFHVSADRAGAVALSIPRDLITDVPDCPTRLRDGTVRTVPGLRGVRFNTSLGQQGRDPGCEMRTVEALTGIRPDHFVMADFTAVKDLSTAVGGVEVCLAKDIDDRGGSGLRLGRGRHVVEGEQALAFVRTRHSVGSGSDLDRIKLQQQFLASLIRRLRSDDTLGSPAKLWTLAQDATRALTVDTGIGTVARLADLVRQLGTLDPRHVTFATVPVVDNPAERWVHSTVVLDAGPARQLFGLIARDRTLAVPSPDASATAPAAPRSAPGAVSVAVFNGSGMFGTARLTVAWLRERHRVGRAVVGGNVQVRARTTLVYPPGRAAQARELAALLGLPGAALAPGPAPAAGAGMALTLGDDFVRPGRPLRKPQPAATPPPGVQEVSASDRGNCAK